MTRLEKIRSMSAEELGGALANFDWEYCRPEYCPHFHGDGRCETIKKHGADGCIPACVNYLNSEVEETSPVSHSADTLPRGEGTSPARDADTLPRGEGTSPARDADTLPRGEG